MVIQLLTKKCSLDLVFMGNFIRIIVHVCEPFIEFAPEVNRSNRKLSVSAPVPELQSACRRLTPSNYTEMGQKVDLFC